VPRDDAKRHDDLVGRPVSLSQPVFRLHHHRPAGDRRAQRHRRHIFKACAALRLL